MTSLDIILPSLSGTKTSLPSSPTITGASTRAFRSNGNSDSQETSTTPTLAPGYEAWNAVIAMNVGGHTSTDNECASVAITGTKMSWDAEL